MIFHKLILTFFKDYFKKLPPKKILNIGITKSLTKIIFFTNLTKKLTKGSICKEKHHQDDVFTNIFRMVLDKHAPLKKKIFRGNKAPFMTKELSKAIMNKSKLQNTYTKWSSRENFFAFKKQKNICKNLNKKTEKNYFSKITSNGVMGDKPIWRPKVFSITKIYNGDKT